MLSLGNYKRDQVNSSNRATRWRIIVAAAFLLAIVVNGCRINPTDEPTVTSTRSTEDLITLEPLAVPKAPAQTMSPPPTFTPVPTVVINTRTRPALAIEESATPLPTLTIAVIGDYGLAGQAAEDVAALVKNWRPDLIITTGDNNYPDGEAGTIDQNIGQYYSEFISPYFGAFRAGNGDNRFFPSPGNHDWNSSELQPYLDYFTLPGNERYYEINRGSVHIFVIDSDTREPDGISLNSIQATWLRDSLEASIAPWKLVVMHHPPFSSGWHGSSDWMQWPYATWGATAVIAGHDHVYERIHHNGLIYFVNGLGGSPARYSFGEPLHDSLVRYNSDHGAMLIEANAERASFQFVTRTGRLIDSIELEAD